MPYNLGSNVTISDFYSQNGYLTIDGVEPTGVTDLTFYATDSITFDGEILLDSDPYTPYPSDIVFEAPKININTVVEGSYYGVSISNNDKNSLTFNNSSVNFDNAEYDTDPNYIGPIAFTGNSSINVTQNTNGKTIIKASTLTGTITLDVEDGVQDGDTFLIDTTVSNQLVIIDGDWTATPSTSGNITTYTLSQAQPVPTTGIDFKKQLRRKLAIMLGSMKKKRPYYCEVEYLENTDKQYINTGLLSTAQSKIDIVFGFSNMASGAANNCAVFGGRSNTVYTVNTFTFFKLASANPQNFRFDYNGQRAIGSASNMTWDTASKYRFTYNGSRAEVTNITTSESDGMNLEPGSSYTETPITLFGVNTRGAVGQNMLGRIYKCRYTDGTTTLDLIPVLDWNMRPAMYDKISGQFFYNANTTGSDFSYGREIHYVDYLESTGTQYIDTGIYLTNNYSVEIDYQLTQATQSRAGLFGGLKSGTGTGRYGALLSPSNNALEAGYGSSNTYYQFGLPDTNRHVMKQEKNLLYFDGTMVNPFAVSTFTMGITAFLGNFNYTDYTPALAKYYSSKWWDNDTLVRDYHPAIDENGVGFMFDKVTHTVFLNAGTGAFKYPPVEVEYLVSNGGQYIDTGLNPTDDWGYHIKNTYTVDAGEQCAMGCMDNGNRFVGTYTGGGERQISGGWGNFVNYLSQSILWTNDTIWDVYCNYKNSRKIVRNDVELKDLTEIHISGTISNTLYLFARNYGSTVTKMKGKIYSVEITNGQNVVAEYVPAFKDGIAGFLNKVDGTFLTNSGTGQFLTGKIIEAKYE